MSIPSWCVKGAKVVCIRAYFHYSPAQEKWAPNVPNFGETYTIRRVARASDGRPGIWLAEIVNPTGLGGWETGFHLQDFRPLVDDANDAEIEAQLYRKKVHQKPAPGKDLERVE